MGEQHDYIMPAAAITATVIHRKSVEVWRAFALMPWETVLYIHVMLWKAYWQDTRAQEQS